MSQCYHTQLMETVRRIVRGEDSISYPIELTSILPGDEMADLLKDQLKAAGWCAGNDDETLFVTQGSGGEVLAIDLSAMELTATIANEREVVAQARVVIASESRNEIDRSAAQLLKREKEVVGDRIEDVGTKEMQQEVTAQLAETEPERLRAMHELLQGVYAAALKRKAGQLGDIMEISESTGADGNYELTIRIEQ